MKNIQFLSIVLCLIMYSCPSESDFIINQEVKDLNDILNIELVDQSDNSQIIVTTAYLKKKWENESLEDGYDVSYDKFQILQTQDEDTNETIYFLKATSKDNTISTGAFLSKNPDSTYKLEGKKCTCTGCSSGCDLKVYGKSCSCTSCFPRGGKCEKKEEITLDDGIDSSTP